MKAIIVHSVSKNQRSLSIAKMMEGDLYRIEHVKRVYKSYFIQLLVYGYYTVSNKKVGLKPLNIDFQKYDEIYLISPVWAGRVNAYMRQFLKDNPFTNKKVHIIASCEGGYKDYFNSMKPLIDPSNQIVEETIYVKDERIT